MAPGGLTPSFRLVSRGVRKHRPALCRVTPAVRIPLPFPSPPTPANQRLQVQASRAGAGSQVMELAVEVTRGPDARLAPMNQALSKLFTFKSQLECHL